MRIILHTRREIGAAARSTSTRRRAQDGSAVLVVLILLVIMVSLALGNNLALARLRSELQLVERRQQSRRAVVETNAPTIASPTTSSSRQAGSIRTPNPPPAP